MEENKARYKLPRIDVMKTLTPAEEAKKYVSFRDRLKSVVSAYPIGTQAYMYVSIYKVCMHKIAILFYWKQSKNHNFLLAEITG